LQACESGDRGCTNRRALKLARLETRVLPMDLRVGDRLTDETGEYEVIGRPYTTNAGKDVHARVKRVDNAQVTMISDVRRTRADCGEERRYVMASLLAGKDMG
jgi:hypothetical protein